MAAPKITKKKTSQKINLKEEFGIDFRGRDSLKQALGQAIIDRMVSRTKDGKSFFGKNFRKYSKDYIDSEDFKAFGKSPGDVNMTLTGDMLASIDILDISGNTIEPGIDDPEEAIKSFAHNTGDGKMPRRAFFGITRKELKEIKSEFDSEIKDAVSVSRNSDEFQTAVLSLIKKIGGEVDGS